jgi:hypothetical protein
MKGGIASDAILPRRRIKLKDVNCAGATGIFQDQRHWISNQNTGGHLKIVAN